ncbi:MAG: class I SAM-dependent methyltransferase [Betaproteobacteria bacterium]|nr:class I SAM-dependent methyltransferase [Betaproteobacteria bacterium]
MSSQLATTSADAEAFKSATRRQWDRAAPGWNAHTAQIREWLQPATDAMLEMAGVRRGTRVLDVAAGAGDQTLDIAQRVGPEGYVLATDLSASILEFAKGNAQRAGYANVGTRVADGESLQVDAGSFDAAVCRLGLMLFPDPRQGLREMHRALKPGAGICTMVFSGPQANPCITTLLSTALKHAGLPPRDPFQPGGLLSLGKPGVIDEMFRDVGFKDVATTRMDAPFRLPSARDYLQFIRTSASPLQQILGKLGAEASDAAWKDMVERLKVFETPEGWTGPNELLLTAARR